MSTRAVLFDYYFTLADPEAPAACAAAAALLDDADYSDVWSAWRKMTVPDVARALGGDPPPFHRYGERWAAHGGTLFTSLGMTADGATWRTCREAAHEHAPLYDDVADALDELRERSVALGVLSDADASWFYASLARSGLTFDAVVCSEDLRCYKPHRSVFLAACDRLSVPAEDVVYVGDNPRLDVVGALNAGLRAIWINRDGSAYPPGLQRPDAEISSLTELPAVLAAM